MQTICGIDIGKLAKAPSPDELGAIVARMNSDDQAKFFISMGEELRNSCGGKHFMQWQHIADSISQLEERLCDGSASQSTDGEQQMAITTNQLVREFAKILDVPLPSEAERTEAYNQELVRRYLTGQCLTKVDRREAEALIAKRGA